MIKTNEEIIEELKDHFPVFHDVIETTEYLGVKISVRFKDWLMEKLESKDKAHREEMIELVESVPDRKCEEPHHSQFSNCLECEILEWKQEKLTQLKND